MHRRVPLPPAFRNLRRLSLTAQLLDAGRNCREMVSRASSASGSPRYQRFDTAAVAAR
jgi:hypothetical protein